MKYIAASICVLAASITISSNSDPPRTNWFVLLALVVAAVFFILGLKDDRLSRLEQAKNKKQRENETWEKPKRQE